MKNRIVWRILMLFAAWLVLANASFAMEMQNTSRDKYENYNRRAYRFNDYLDSHFLKPAAMLYNKIMPKPLNRGIHNMFVNATELRTIPNDLLQLHFAQCFNDVWRFSINSTVGVLGFFDVANHMQLPSYINDFGLTLARYGYTDSDYFVLPFWGPSTFRDAGSMPVDYYAFEFYSAIHPIEARYGVYGLGVVDRRAQLLQYQTLFEAAAVDEYAFIRNAYLQRRAHQIEENRHLGYTGRANMPDPGTPVAGKG